MTVAESKGSQPSNPEAGPRPIQDDEVHRRSHPRFAVELDLSIGNAQNFYAGVVENVSVGGVFIATHLCRPVGELVEITIHLTDGDEPVRGIGEVRWVRALSEPDDLPPGMGIRFVELNEGARDAIERFLQRTRMPSFHDR